MRVKVLTEICPESRHHILDCEVTYWHSFITRKKDFVTILLRQVGDRGPIEAFICPDMRPTKSDPVYYAFKRWEKQKKQEEASQELKEKFQDYFEEPLTGPATYRSSPIPDSEEFTGETECP